MFQEIKKSRKNTSPSSQVRRLINSINASFDVILNDWNSMDWFELHMMNKQQALFINELRLYSKEELKRIFLLLEQNKQQTIIGAIDKYGGGMYSVNNKFIIEMKSLSLFLNKVLSENELANDENKVNDQEIVIKHKQINDNINF